MKKKLLVLNLGIDSDNTSLAFTQTWVNKLSQHYEKIDVITLRVGDRYKLNENVNLYYINTKNSKLTNETKKLKKVLTLKSLKSS